MIDSLFFTPEVAKELEQRRKRQKFESLMAQNPKFSGDDYDPSRDKNRLTGQAGRIFLCMNDGKWRTLKQIASATGDPEASISAQLRNLRKPSFGAHTIKKHHVGAGLYQYLLVANQG